MKGAVKWVSIIVGSLIVLVILALLLIPMFAETNRHGPTPWASTCTSETRGARREAGAHV